MKMEINMEFGLNLEKNLSLNVNTMETKIGKFTETHLMADENSPAKTQGIYRVGKLSGEIVNLYSNVSNRIC